MICTSSGRAGSERAAVKTAADTIIANEAVSSAERGRCSRASLDIGRPLGSPAILKTLLGPMMKNHSVAVVDSRFAAHRRLLPTPPDSSPSISRTDGIPSSRWGPPRTRRIIDEFDSETLLLLATSVNAYLGFSNVRGLYARRPVLTGRIPRAARGSPAHHPRGDPARRLDPEHGPDRCPERHGRDPRRFDRDADDRLRGGESARGLPHHRRPPGLPDEGERPGRPRDRRRGYHDRGSPEGQDAANRQVAPAVSLGCGELQAGGP